MDCPTQMTAIGGHVALSPLFLVMQRQLVGDLGLY